MLLAELFKSKSSFDVVENGSEEYIVTTKLKNGKDLTLTCYLYKGVRQATYWEVSFDVDRNYDKTGDGNEIEVFSIVIEMIRHFIITKDPFMICMTADPENRAKLYMRILQRVLKWWKIIQLHVPNTNESRISAINSDEFPIIQYGNQTLVGLGSTSPGYNDRGEEDLFLQQMTAGEREQISTELTKAKGMVDK